MDAVIRVLGITGSLRTGSYNRALLTAAEERLPEGIHLRIFELHGIPLFNQDLESGGFPQPVVELHEAVRSADALLFAVPEYNYSMSGVLKNAIDWASRPPGKSPLAGKPAAVMGATQGLMGTARAQSHFRQVCHGVDLRLLNRPEVLVAQAQNKFDASGRLIDEATGKRIVALLESLKDWTIRLR